MFTDNHKLSASLYMEHSRSRKSIEEGLPRTRTVKSFGAGVVINYEYNEFVRDQNEKRRSRIVLVALIVFFPACILLLWGIAHLVLGLTAVTASSRLSYVINRDVQVALATIQLNFEGGDMAYAVLTGLRSGTTQNHKLLAEQSQTDKTINQPVLWDKSFFRADRVMYPSGQFTYTTYAELQLCLTTHRLAFWTALNQTSNNVDDVLAQWQWYRALTNDIYAQIQEIFQANTDMAIWPNYLDTDYAVMYHRAVNHKRVLGTVLLYQGAVYSGARSIWMDMVGYISSEELLYSSAFFMAPSFRRFMRNIQNNEKTTKINWTLISEFESVLQNIYVTQTEGKSPFPAQAAQGDLYFLELTKIMQEIQQYVVRSSSKILTGLADQEYSDFAKCAWSAILLLVTVGGGILNIYAIWSFVQHFVMQVKESAVEHRDKTLDLRMERRKTNMVLHTMLPRKVADELKFRKFVRPTYYESVSMYFSDVQGFTALSSRSEPQDIVVMLTELYTTFDDILNDYKVWKLETIGDAYCILAGATNQHEFESPMEHAVEIVNCSLAIRDYIRHYPIPHLPEEIVKIRIGVHTGSVVAGVAGVGMHRYCVVGDALHVVEQVEASGMHGRVHISEDTKNAVYAVSSSDSFGQPVDESASITQYHPNSAKYICIPNNDAELEIHDHVVKTYWIDRRDSDFARSLEGAYMVKRRSYGEINLLHPHHEHILMHRTSQPAEGPLQVDVLAPPVRFLEISDIFPEVPEKPEQVIVQPLIGSPLLASADPPESQQDPDAGFEISLTIPDLSSGHSIEVVTEDEEFFTTTSVGLYLSESDQNVAHIVL